TLLTIVPLVSLMVLNGRIIYEIHRSSRYLQNYLGVDWRVRSIVSSEELKITMMLVSVVLAFFVCHAPYMVYTAVVAFREFDPEKHPELTSSDMMTYLRHICHSLLALKSVCNFILYCWFSDKFWATFKRMFCKQKCRGKKLSYRHGSCNNGHHCRFSSRTHPLRSSDYVSKETTC
ncbi:FMRFamide receptor, partial [Biomphalaria glabrata]